MKLLKAIVMGTAIMMISQAAMAVDICTSSGSTIICDNSATDYTEWIVGKDLEDDTVYACARISGVWTLVGEEEYDSHTKLEVEGCDLAERITMVETTTTESLCDYGDDIYAEAFPSGWFVQGIEVHGYDGEDNIHGSYRAEQLHGDDEGDTIWGNGGNDTICGGNGTDTLYGITGVNSMYGDAHNDVINGGDITDYIWGGTGNDTIYGNDGADQLHGDTGRDFLHGGDGNDTLWGDADGDSCWGDAHDFDPPADTCYCEVEAACCEY